MSDFRTIPLTRGLEAIVDASDYEALSAHRWGAQHSQGGIYASRKYRDGGRHITVLMHREIMAAAAGVHIDHISGDRLDNRRANLRECSRSQNSANSAARSNSKSGFKGVSWLTARGCWVARLRDGSVSHFLGSFADKADAARAYDAAAIKIHGAFARLNFPEAV